MTSIDEYVPSLDKDSNPRLRKDGSPIMKRNPDYIDLPQLPNKGDLDLEEIMDSWYSHLTSRRALCPP